MSNVVIYFTHSHWNKRDTRVYKLSVTFPLSESFRIPNAQLHEIPLYKYRKALQNFKEGEIWHSPHVMAVPQNRLLSQGVRCGTSSLSEARILHNQCSKYIAPFIKNIVIQNNMQRKNPFIIVIIYTYIPLTLYPEGLTEVS
jgi:hypothetical protein